MNNIIVVIVVIVVIVELGEAEDEIFKRRRDTDVSISELVNSRESLKVLIYTCTFFTVNGNRALPPVYTPLVFG